MSQAVKQFEERSPAQRFSVIALITAALGLVTAAERDIQPRSADQVRGNKLLWRFVCLNAVGSASYFRWGRRAPQQ